MVSFPQSNSSINKEKGTIRAQKGKEYIAHTHPMLQQWKRVRNPVTGLGVGGAFGLYIMENYDLYPQIHQPVKKIVTGQGVGGGWLSMSMSQKVAIG
jgi:hypothetical protein